MIWHIFRKDARLLWPMVVAVALLQWLSVAASVRLGLFPDDKIMYRLAATLSLIAVAGSVVLMAAAVQCDAIPGVRQDWLVRPIGRMDLLFAKLLFVFLLVQGPVLLGNLMQGLALGFPLGQSFVAAAGETTSVLVILCLPVVAFAALTSSLTEMLVGGVAAIVVFLIVTVNSHGSIFGWVSPASGTGLAWTVDASRATVCLAGSSAILGLQYLRRKTWAARFIAVAVACFAVAVSFIPWSTAFAVQQAVASNPAASAGISLVFDPKAGRFHDSRLIGGESVSNASAATFTLSISRPSISVYIPLRVDGLPPDSGLNIDHVDGRLIDSTGQTVYTFFNGSDEADFRMRRDGAGDPGVRDFQPIAIGSFAELRDKPLRLDIDYSLTLLRLSAAHAIPALNGNQRLPGIGWCGTKTVDGAAIELNCINAGNEPVCATLFLENRSTGQRNPAVAKCKADYTPWVGDSLARLMGDDGMRVLFRDPVAPAGLVPFPVDGSQLAASQVVLRTYDAQDHFVRHLTIPNIRLRDWLPKER